MRQPKVGIPIGYCDNQKSPFRNLWIQTACGRGLAFSIGLNTSDQNQDTGKIQANEQPRPVG